MESHPHLVRLRCSDCQMYVHDMDTGECKTYEGPEGKELPILRPGPPPCGDCPKESPDREHLYVLSWKNRRTLDLYRRAKADPCFEMPHHLRGDQLLQENFAAIAQVERDAERRDNQQQGQMLQMLVTALLRR